MRSNVKSFLLFVIFYFFYFGYGWFPICKDKVQYILNSVTLWFNFAMSDFSSILVLQIKICIKPDRHGKGSNKIWETLSFWRNFSNYASLWRFLLRCTLFCHSVATFLTSVSSYEGGCGFEVFIQKRQDSQRNTSHICRKSHILWDNSLIFCIADDFCKFFDAMMEKIYTESR